MQASRGGGGSEQKKLGMVPSFGGFRGLGV